MEIYSHFRIVDARKKDQADSFMNYLEDVIFDYRDAGDIFVSVKSEFGNNIVLEELSIHESYVKKALHHCLFVSPPSFEMICKIRVVTI